VSDLVVRPVRFTDRIEEMRVFLEAIGLRPRYESVRGGWVDMVADSGMVALHSAAEAVRAAPSGLTTLSFEAADVDALAARLRDAGVPDVVVYDESYGRVLSCRDPAGAEIVADERSDDLYGYRSHEPGRQRAGWRVLPVCFTDPLGPYAEFLAAFGLHRRTGGDHHFTAYLAGSGDDEAGAVGLHAVADEGVRAGSLRGEAEGVALSFETTEPLEAVAARLDAAGSVPLLSAQPFGSVLSVQDADGRHVEIIASSDLPG
jgi:hypothetical protein